MMWQQVRRGLAVGFVSVLAGWPLAGHGWGCAACALALRGAAPQPTVEVKADAGRGYSHWPVTVGVPFPQGSVRDPSTLQLTDGGTTTAVQARLLSRWPDGSARWVLLDWQVDLPAGQQRRFGITTGAPRPALAAIKLQDLGDRFEVDTGPLQFAIPKKHFAIIDNARLNGVPVTSAPILPFFDINGTRSDAQAPTDVSVIDAGPLRVRIQLRGHYSAGFDYVVRIDAFARQPFVRVLHSFEQHAASPYTMVRQIGIDVPQAFDGPIAYSAGGAGGAVFTNQLPHDGVSLVQEDNDAFRIGTMRQAGHAGGWVDLHDATHGVAVVGRYFWQEYPQSFQLRPTGLTYNLWAPEARPAKIGMGAAKTHELVLVFHDRQLPAPAVLETVAQPLLARVDAQWIVSTHALRNSISPSAATDPFLRAVAAGYQRYQSGAEVERWDDSGQVGCPPTSSAQQPRHGFYGMFNWGDWNFPGYHDTVKGCDAWGNLEYDMTQVLALAYAATGESAYYDGMVAAARHFTDVDHIYYAPDHPTFVGMNHPKNPLHFTFELGGIDLGHTWTEGLLSYYELTGDTRSLEAARGIADYLVERLRAKPSKGNPRQFGWPQIALVAAYETTGDARYKTAAAEYARRGMLAHPAESVAIDKVRGWKMGILAEALAYTHSVTGEEAMRDWLLRYATALRTHNTVSDPRYFPAVAYAAGITHQAADIRAAKMAVERLRFGTWAKPFTIGARLGFSLLSSLAASP